MRRLDEPLRVAIAGRVKAGKSTLLNALVGERLAATDAGECTRVVTWYRNALGYRVVAELRTGGLARPRVPPRGRRARRSTSATSTVDAIDRIEVGWPSPEARRPDAHRHARASRRPPRAPRSGPTRALLDDEGDGPGEADAVLYLMRHLHRSDVEFLEAFVDRSVAHASPINAIVVLSRADEIGAARPDALDSARAVAARYGADARVRELASGVVPVAGLIAETGATLREAQFGWLREVAALPEASRDHLLLSVDRFRDPDAEPARRGDPRGAAGAARDVRAPPGGRPARRRRGRAPSTELSAALLERSGIRELQRILTERYAGAGPGPQGTLGAGRPAGRSARSSTGAASTARRTSSWRSTGSRRRRRSWPCSGCSTSC